ncbi:hypothetical protein CAPTEDRAFT_36345, partial [Capitella teleta]
AWTAGVYLAVSGTACILGTLGNLLVLGSVVMYKPLRHRRNAFVVNLAVADLTVTSFADPMGILGMVYGSEWFVRRVVLCDAVATVCIAACVTALFSIGGDGFSRFCHICHPHAYHRLFTLRTNIIICIFIWLAGFGMSLPALVGWTDNIYDPKYMECIWNRKYSMTYTIFFSTCVVAAPVAIIAISFIKIYIHVQSSRKRVAVYRNQSVNQAKSLSIKLARSLFIVFTGFVACWTPYAIIVIVDFKDRAPEEVHLFILLLAHMHSTLNAIIYAMSNAQFRKGYLVALTSLYPCSARF